MLQKDLAILINKSNGVRYYRQTQKNHKRQAIKRTSVGNCKRGTNKRGTGQT